MSERRIDVFFCGLFMDRQLAVLQSLPEPPALDERHADYAAKLRAVAQRIGLPSEYVESIQ